MSDCYGSIIPSAELVVEGGNVPYAVTLGGQTALPTPGICGDIVILDFDFGVRQNARVSPVRLRFGFLERR
jgi:hypothetical protein